MVSELEQHETIRQISLLRNHAKTIRQACLCTKLNSMSNRKASRVIDTRCFFYSTVREGVVYYKKTN